MIGLWKLGLLTHFFGVQIRAPYLFHLASEHYEIETILMDRIDGVTAPTQ